MKTSEIISRFNYLYVALILLWVPLHGTIISFDEKERILFVLTLIAFIVNNNKATYKRISFPKLVAF